MREEKGHSGHRERMFEKLSKKAVLNPHEYLEILLFNALPRVDTRPIAHNLLQDFGDLQSIFSAPIDALQNTQGVGKQTAAYLHCIGKLLENYKEVSQHAFPVYYDALTFLGFLKAEYEQTPYEVLDAYLLDEDNRILGRKRFTIEDVANVQLRTDEFIDCLMDDVPSGVVLVHNHPSGAPKPSKLDEMATRRCQTVCSVHNVLFCEHIIFCKNGAYSYYMSGQMKKFGETYSLNRMLSAAKKGE